MVPPLVPFRAEALVRAEPVKVIARARLAAELGRDGLKLIIENR